MRLHKTKLLILLFVVIGFSFSSCDTLDYRWVEGSLDYRRVVPLNSYGVAAEEFTIDKGWVETNNGSNRDISDIRFKGGNIVISVRNFRDLDYVTLRIVDTNVQLDMLPKYNGANVFEDRNVTNFLSVVVDKLRRNERVIVLVDAEGYARTDFTLELITDLDVYTLY